jgi:hypothetical protein
MDERLIEAVRLVGVYTAGRFQLWSLAGPAKASCRAHVASVFHGVKVPQGKAGVNALRDALYPAVGASGACEAVRAEDFAAKCRRLIGA